MRIPLQPESRSALEAKGWSEDRQVDVSPVIERLTGAGYEINERMAEVLSSLSGLTLNPVVEEGIGFRNDEPLIVDPIGVGVRRLKEARDLEEWFKVPFCPLGWWLCRSHVYFSSEGLVVASAPGVVWHLGDSLPEAIDFMVLANRPLVRLWSMDGMDDSS
ncbi:SUKH-3 domain-containing protein [Streptomyces sp. AK02-01A]|uniref:SUKH-3 domain-containing protein n=1 Tax=Streptomyces sp. AK02-01A TaxID=3028648 RepID=UPI0029A6994F|nr:SUKH-3 domain-containing protein [Streptomyces sp. AK02-01A]MDX3855796.1 SUKH-3 domain-containing protein [Streptomyces sp. AK02-01A]